jgi:DNA adenine methylase
MNQHPTSTASSAGTSARQTKPFLKWAGGKVRLLPQLLPLFPPGSKRLIEPFVGAGSVFLATDYDSYVINDANPDLVAMWTALQSRPREFMERAAELFVEQNRYPEAYVSIRAQFNAEVDSFERAVLLPYLNRFGFNGLYRVNSKGEFNVPYGQLKELPYFRWDEMEAASRKLQRCLILNGGFRAAIEMAGEDDVVYCDPPYVDDDEPSFTQYTSARFGIAHQYELVQACEAAVERGATVLISNHDTDTTRALYTGWDIHEVSVRRSLSASAASRGTARELVARLRP